MLCIPDSVPFSYAYKLFNSQPQWDAWKADFSGRLIIVQRKFRTQDADLLQIEWNL